MTEESPISYSHSLTEVDAHKNKRRNWTKIILLTLIVVIFVILCAAAGFFFFYLLPFRPIVEVLSFETKNVALTGNTPLGTKLPQLSQIQWTQQTLTAKIVPKLKFQNRYHFGLSFQTIQVELFPSGTKHKMGMGTMDALTVDKRSTIEFEFPIDVSVKLASPLGKEIVSQCLRKQKLSLSILIKPTLHLGKIEFSIKFTKQHQLDCRTLFKSFVK